MARKKPAEIDEPVKITPNQIVAFNLTEARRFRGWTQEDLAAVMGRPSQAISDRRTSCEKSTWPGVSIKFSKYCLPSGAV